MASSVRSVSSDAVQRRAIGGASASLSSTPLRIGPMDRRADLQVDGVAALDLDLLVPDGERKRLALVEVVGRVGRIDRLDDQVLHVGVDVGGAPRDAGVVAEDHAGHAREGDAGHVVRAGRVDRPAVQPVHVPDRRHRDPEVRVVGQQRAAADRHRRRDDPVVGADPVVRGEAVRPVETGHLEGRLPELGDRPPGRGVGGVERPRDRADRRHAGGRGQPGRRLRPRRWPPPWPRRRPIPAGRSG